MNFQALLDGIRLETQKARSTAQMTLGKLIDELGELPPKTLVELSSPHSYRGYYEDLAFSYGEKTTAKKALQLCHNAMGQIFVGYKGGDFQMGRNTPVWVAFHGQLGQKIMSIKDNGELVLCEDTD